MRQALYGKMKTQEDEKEKDKKEGFIMEHWHQFGDVLTLESEKGNQHVQTIIFLKETGSDVIGIPLVPQILQTTSETQLIIPKSEENGLTSDSIALCHQGLQLSGSCVKEKIGQLTFEETDQINQILMNLSR